MIKTITELFSYSGGQTCQETRDLLDKYYSGWDESTEIDVLPYLEYHRAEDKIIFALVGLFSGMSDDHKQNYIDWGMGILEGIMLNDYYSDKKAVIAALPLEYMSIRMLRTILIKNTSITDGDILTKCEELLGL